MTKRDYEMEWMRLDYLEGMGSAKFLPPPDSNFVRAYHLTSAEHGESDIRLGRLKVAQFSEVNDPFELMALNFHKPETFQLAKDFKDEHNIKTGLLCFSKNWTNPVLWSHYAEKHKGICLGFDLRREGVQEVPTLRSVYGCKTMIRSPFPGILKISRIQALTRRLEFFLPAKI